MVLSLLSVYFECEKRFSNL